MPRRGSVRSRIGDPDYVAPREHPHDRLRGCFRRCRRRRRRYYDRWRSLRHGAPPEQKSAPAEQDNGRDRAGEGEATGAGRRLMHLKTIAKFAQCSIAQALKVRMSSVGSKPTMRDA
ncbi:hypothetical protein HMP06_2350 [Sphingomonas sp. HMP6]|nr:hypothetical protein HMP06_2350 [Sphingomonas sp. HMP6]